MTELKLVAIDLDGTLLDDGKRLSDRNLNALNQTLSKGVLVALASARDCASIRLKVPIELPGLYYIGSGGALIYEVATRKVRWSSQLSPELVAESVLFLREFGHPVFLNSMDDYWVDRYNERVRMIEERYNLQTQPFSDPLAVARPIMRVSLAAPVLVLEQAAARAKSLVGDRVQVSFASPDWLDLLSMDAGKGCALAFLQGMFRIHPDQTMAIGDYESDLPLFEHSRHRIAMNNAVPALKTAASHITGTNNEDGVAQILETYLR